MTRGPRLLTIMGSGETAPTMTKVHRTLFDRIDGAATKAVLLDTPYGFQENADDISKRTVTYFGRNLGVTLEVATWRRASVDALEREQALGRIREADYVFAGPGSPSYALGVWSGTALREVLAERLRRRGVVTFASAAALTLGLVSIPVYEIYKVGAPAHWLDGLDLFGELGLRVAVVPHFDNAEGGTHDTRFCYLGERRLRAMEAELPEDVFILGVDEHTACVIDLDESTVSVLGRGSVTVRRRGHAHAFPADTVIPLAEITAAGLAPRGTRAAAPAEVAFEPTAQPEIPSLGGEAARLEQEFGAAIAHRDGPGATGSALELEQVLFDWAADMEAGDMERARAALRGMVVRLGEAAATGLGDPRAVMVPLVESLVDLREQARAERAWSLADGLRDRLATAGVELRDTPEGTRWRFSDD